MSIVPLPERRLEIIIFMLSKIYTKILDFADKGQELYLPLHH